MYKRQVCFLRTGRSQNPENKSVLFFIKPITVSQTISSDIDIRTYIEGKTREEAESVKDRCV